jgi:hypothetical protein
VCAKPGTLSHDSVACFYKPRALGLGEDKQFKKAAVLDEAAMGPHTRLVFALLKSSLFVRFLEQMSGIEDIVADPHFRGSGRGLTLVLGRAQLEQLQDTFMS